ncbi:MAG: GH1 family beta-glucosidase [Defluviitaleaceae bacterium]|nr:GH1 family beta-glucosidase [Defluviitaleaceae bacterium]
MNFRKDFIWGAATAAFQIEGAAYADGKGASVWDAFCEQPGKVFGGHDGLVACDHYNRYKEDVATMKEIGISAYRFSICWPRIMPHGMGRVNENGIKFYSDLIDELLKNNITPYVTLFHWDYPYELFCRGGWLNPDSPKWFGDYAEVCTKAFGDRVQNFITINEPQCFIGLGHRVGVHAPGIVYPLKDCLQMGHHVLMGHGLAVQAIRANAKNSSVGYAPTGSFYYPNTESQKDIEAAKKATFSVTTDRWFFSSAWWSDPVFLGKYPMPTGDEKDMDVFKTFIANVKESDMALIKQPLDYYGQNCYDTAPIEHQDNEPGYRASEFPIGHPKTAIGWPITPEGYYWMPKFLHERYKLPVLITESGMSSHDAVSPDGGVHDVTRIDYIRSHLQSLEKAAADGVDILGHFYWSLLDNFEWAKGYNDRFGLVYVDYATQKRTLKDSALWYKKLIAEFANNK